MNKSTQIIWVSSIIEAFLQSWLKYKGAKKIIKTFFTFFLAITIKSIGKVKSQKQHNFLFDFQFVIFNDSFKLLGLYAKALCNQEPLTGNSSNARYEVWFKCIIIKNGKNLSLAISSFNFPTAISENW